MPTDSPNKEGKPLVSDFHEASTYYGISVTELTDLNEVSQDIAAHLPESNCDMCLTFLQTFAEQRSREA